MADLAITRINAPERLQPYVAAWSSIVGDEPMRSPCWLLGWWEQYGGTGKELSVLLVQDGDKLVGVAPLYQETRRRRSVYKLLGSGEVCSDHVAWFALPAYREHVGITIGRYLLQKNHWRRLQLEAVDVNDAAMAASLDFMRRNGCLIERSPTVSCWAIDIPETWDEFLTLLSKSHRKRCRRLCREYFDSGRVTTHVARTAEEFQNVWHRLLELHAKRWATASHPGGVFDGPRFRTFHERVARELLANDQLRLAWLSCDGSPIAAEYQFLDARTLYAYQSGMDPALGALQPGNLSLIATIRFAIEYQLSTVDLLRGDEPYKAHWRAQPHARANVRVWPGKFADHLEKTIGSVRAVAKDWLRSTERVGST